MLFTSWKLKSPRPCPAESATPVPAPVPVCLCLCLYRVAAIPQSRACPEKSNISSDMSIVHVHLSPCAWSTCAVASPQPHIQVIVPSQGRYCRCPAANGPPSDRPMACPCVVRMSEKNSAAVAFFSTFPFRLSGFPLSNMRNPPCGYSARPRACVYSPLATLPIRCCWPWHGCR